MIGSSYNNCEGGNFISTAGVALTAHAPIYSSYPCPPVPFGGDTAVIQFLDASISAQGSYSSTVGNVMGGDSYIFPFCAPGADALWPSSASCSHFPVRAMDFWKHDPHLPAYRAARFIEHAVGSDDRDSTGAGQRADGFSSGTALESICRVIGEMPLLASRLSAMTRRWGDLYPP